jgi:hypothetical protein
MDRDDDSEWFLAMLLSQIAAQKLFVFWVPHARQAYDSASAAATAPKHNIARASLA